MKPLTWTDSPPGPEDVVDAALVFDREAAWQNQNFPSFPKGKRHEKTALES